MPASPQHKLQDGPLPPPQMQIRVYLSQQRYKGEACAKVSTDQMLRATYIDPSPCPRGCPALLLGPSYWAEAHSHTCGFGEFLRGEVQQSGLGPLGESEVQTVSLGNGEGK